LLPGEFILSTINSRIILHERGVCACGFGPLQVYSQRFAQSLCLHIEIVDNFHVIGNKAYGRQDHITYSGFVGGFEQLQDIRFQPRLTGRTAAALKCEFPVTVGGGLLLPAGRLR